MIKTNHEDICVVAYPSKNHVVMIANTVDGREYMRNKFNAEQCTILASDVNDTFKDIKEHNLRFSFKSV